ncbi:Ran-binding protein 3 [Trichoplax sp. H2]|nr:Ran-binding protein 3 [Trichoplax sp. H2]|eukprot:RDD37525.1 Ran-binding protein 3 [Trichoplax sp. H2]
MSDEVEKVEDRAEVAESNEDHVGKRKLEEEEEVKGRDHFIENNQETEECKRKKTSPDEGETEKEVYAIGSDMASGFFAPSRLKPAAIPVMQFTNLTSESSSSFGGSAWKEALNIKQPFSFMSCHSESVKSSSSNQDNDNLPTKGDNFALNGDDITKENIFQKFLKKNDSQNANSKSETSENNPSKSDTKITEESDPEKTQKISTEVQESSKDDAEKNEPSSSSFEKSLPIGSTKLDRKYEEVPVVTGEEHETQMIEMPCQLYKFVPSSKVWQECGRGILHLNDSKSPDNEVLQSRIVIRANATHRVILNTKVWPKMKAEKANSTSLRFTAYDMNSEVCIYLIQSRNSDLIKQLQQAIDVRTRSL